jgi:hypothetical protein
LKKEKTLNEEEEEEGIQPAIFFWLLFKNNDNDGLKSRLLGKRTRGLFRTFEDFEFRAAFTDRKNTRTFGAVMVKKLKLPFSYLKLGRKFVVILQGTRVRAIDSAHYIALLIYTCFCAYTIQAPQQTEKSGAYFKILKCSKQTLSNLL